jgi:hypothetical protein
MSFSIELTEGLRFDGDPDTNVDDCVTIDHDAICTAPEPLPAGTGAAFAPQWKIVGSEYGTHGMRAEIFDESTPDPSPADNSTEDPIELARPPVAAGRAGAA